MVTINSDAKTIKELLSNNNKQFLIPDYQRPYSWKIEQCQTLWNDLWDFVFPNGSKENFDSEKDNYFLGDVTFFPNEKNQNEIIDGQQRIITLILLLRAFYEYLQIDKAPLTQNIFKDIERCLWLTDELGKRKLDCLKVTSDFLEKSENVLFKSLLTTGTARKDAKDNFSRNYNFFRDLIKDCGGKDFVFFPARILNNCYVVQIGTNSQAEALQVFTSVNDRGLPLNTTDIFRSVLYKKFMGRGEEEKYKFINDWDILTKNSKNYFRQTTKITAFEILLMAYGYNFDGYQNIRNVKKFFEKDNHSKLLADNFIPDLFELIGFWQDVYEQNKMTFSEKVLRKIFTLVRSPETKPKLALSGLFFYLRDENALNDDDILSELLGRFIAYTVARSLQGEIPNTMKYHWNKKEWQILTKNPEKVFDSCRLSKSSVENLFRNFSEARNKTFVRQVVLSYWFFKNETQELPSPKDKFSIEHIVSRDMTNFQKFQNPDLIESLGNMAFLESRINTRANNSTFEIKKQCYLGFTDKGKHSPGTVNRELQYIAQNFNDFTETDVRNRNEAMLQAVLDLLGKYDLLKK